mgnify:CR=1 FL=1
MKYSVIDISSSSISMVVAEVNDRVTEIVFKDRASLTLLHYLEGRDLNARGIEKLTEAVSIMKDKCVSLDVNSMKPLDNLCHPVSVIKEAEELAAEAFRADHAFFMVGGTTSSVQGMVLSCCKAGDKIILPRNVHKSVINALVLCGAVPVYVNPEVDTKLGISLGMQVSEVERAIRENPDAAAVLVNNPTYYGICSDLRAIVKVAHEHNMLVLADEAHGTHLYFGSDLPVCAMDAGADMASVSMLNCPKTKAYGL